MRNPLFIGVAPALLLLYAAIQKTFAEVHRLKSCAETR